MTAITRETVEHYARLASLSFEAEEADHLAHDLGTILDYVDKIAELDLSDVPATSQILHQVTPLRHDQAEAGLSQKEALANAPDAESGHFLVPKVIAR